MESRYDVALAQQFVAQARTEIGVGAVLPDALLVLAELYRIDFEALADAERSERRALGKEIDALADEALSIVDALPDSSHRQRLTADLLGVKIRSNYQAKKYRKRMEQAAAMAIQLDSKNAAAYVSAAKPFLFADEDHRGDIGQAVKLLEAALEHDPELEKAHLLLAYADEQNGNNEGAAKRYAIVLHTNPNCRPAKEALLALKPHSTEESP